MITYIKLNNGTWGVRGRELSSGSTITVTKHDGTTKEEVIDRVIWVGSDGICLATVKKSKH